MFTTMTSKYRVIVSRQPEELGQRNFFLVILTPKQSCMRKLTPLDYFHYDVKNCGNDLTFSN